MICLEVCESSTSLSRMPGSSDAVGSNCLQDCWIYPRQRMTSPSIGVSMEQRSNGGHGKREIPEKTRRRDSRVRKSGSDPAGNRTRLALRGDRCSHCATTATQLRVTGLGGHDQRTVITKQDQSGASAGPTIQQLQGNQPISVGRHTTETPPLHTVTTSFLRCTTPRERGCAIMCDDTLHRKKARDTTLLHTAVTCPVDESGRARKGDVGTVKDYALLIATISIGVLTTQTVLIFRAKTLTLHNLWHPTGLIITIYCRMGVVERDLLDSDSAGCRSGVHGLVVLAGVSSAPRGYTPYAYNDRKSSRQKGVGQPWPAIEAMTTSLSVLIAKLSLDETGKNRHRHRKNPAVSRHRSNLIYYSSLPLNVPRRGRVSITAGLTRRDLTIPGARASPTSPNNTACSNTQLHAPTSHATCSTRMFPRPCPPGRAIPSFGSRKYAKLNLISPRYVPVVYWSDYSPHTKVNRVRFPAGSHVGNVTDVAVGWWVFPPFDAGVSGVSSAGVNRGKTQWTHAPTGDTQEVKDGAILRPPGGAAVAERLVCSPPIKANRVQLPAGYSHLGIVMYDAAARRVFSEISRSSCLFILALLHISITLIGSQDLVVKSRPNLFTHSLTQHPAKCFADMWTFLQHMLNASSVSEQQFRSDGKAPGFSAAQATWCFVFGEGVVGKGGSQDTPRMALRGLRWRNRESLLGGVREMADYLAAGLRHEMRFRLPTAVLLLERMGPKIYSYVPFASCLFMLHTFCSVVEYSALEEAMGNLEKSVIGNSRHRPCNVPVHDSGHVDYDGLKDAILYGRLQEAQAWVPCGRENFGRGFSCGECGGHCGGVEVFSGLSRFLLHSAIVHPLLATNLTLSSDLLGTTGMSVPLAVPSAPLDGSLLSSTLIRPRSYSPVFSSRGVREKSRVLASVSAGASANVWPAITQLGAGTVKQRDPRAVCALHPRHTLQLASSLPYLQPRAVAHLAPLATRGALRVSPWRDLRLTTTRRSLNSIFAHCQEHG
ncbi:hypothetical protein PR048_002977 [Dryococelus australis]|uniref:Uncharacterized protein n=1 Tax=Dryococelus australis TaxID=614101 RepID=A0ABQ9ILQ3_9NEOP|nr:hypothetical protein PR048_002977 [Dryococelus australis]